MTNQNGVEAESTQTNRAPLASSVLEKSIGELNILSAKIKTGSNGPKKVLYVTPEVRPFSQSGGLGSVARDLPIKLKEMKRHELVVATPWYNNLEANIAKHNKKIIQDIEKLYKDLKEDLGGLRQEKEQIEKEQNTQRLTEVEENIKKLEETVQAAKEKWEEAKEGKYAVEQPKAGKDIDVPFEGGISKAKTATITHEGVTYLFIKEKEMAGKPLQYSGATHPVNGKPASSYSASPQSAYSTTAYHPQSSYSATAYHPKNLNAENTSHLNNGVSSANSETHDAHINDYNAEKARVKGFHYFCRAVPQAAASLDFTPDIVHCNDWQTGTFPLILKHAEEHTLPKGYKNLPTILNVHRGEFIGDMVPTLDESFGWLRLKKSIELDAFKSKMSNYYNGQANPMGMAGELTEMIIPVSNGYAKELTEDVKGETFWTKYHLYQDKIKGIVNRINTNVWDAETNRAISMIGSNFSADDLSGKAKNKQVLNEIYNFVEPDRPLLSYIGRIGKEKGITLIRDSIDQLVEQGFNLFIGGPLMSGKENAECAQAIHEAAKRHPGRVFANCLSTDGIPYDNVQRIFAGSDFALVPSISEPCGVVQMEAQAMAAIPIGRMVGGIPDTIEHGKTGFLFEDPTSEALVEQAIEAKQIYDKEPEKLVEMQKACLTVDKSWRPSVEAYDACYDQAIEKNRGRISTLSM